jgi:hypothetical protein
MKCFYIKGDRDDAPYMYHMDPGPFSHHPEAYATMKDHISHSPIPKLLSIDDSDRTSKKLDELKIPYKIYTVEIQ